MEFVENELTAYIDEMQQFIYDEYSELEVPIRSIRHVLECEKWSCKVVQARAVQRSTPLRLFRLRQYLRHTHTALLNSSGELVV
jgi:hypothetical protein